MVWNNRDYIRNKKKIVRLYKSRNVQELLDELLKIPCVELSKNGIKTPLPLDDRSVVQCYTAAYILKKLRSFPEGAAAVRDLLKKYKSGVVSKKGKPIIKEK